jgi:hypothetical protein
MNNNNKSNVNITQIGNFVVTQPLMVIPALGRCRQEDEKL